MIKQKDKTAHLLLQSKAIKLEPATPFTWASGWKSPIYCDNRITLSFPEIRNEIRDQFTQTIKTLYPDAELIAGVATGAIAQGVLVAQELGLPFIYVRSSAKDHGMKNLIEGYFTRGQKTVVIEDLISTGGSSLKAVEALKDSGITVLGMLAIFTYGFQVATDNFKKAGIRIDTLSDYDNMLKEAVNSGYISKSDLPLLQEWRKNPEKWTGKSE